MRKKLTLQKLNELSSMSKKIAVLANRANDKLQDALFILDEARDYSNLSLANMAHFQAIVDELRAPFLQKEVLKAQTKLRGGKKR